MQAVGLQDLEMHMMGGAVGWWPSDALLAYQAVGAASYDASLVNLAQPGTNNAYAGTAPAWNTTDGWIFDGTTSSRFLYAGGINPTDMRMLVVDFGGGGSSMFGALGGGRDATNEGGVILFVNAPAGNRTFDYGSRALVNLAAATSETNAINGTTVWINTKRTQTTLGVSTHSAAMTIGALNTGGSIGSFVNVSIRSVCAVNRVLDDSEMTTLIANMKALA